MATEPASPSHFLTILRLVSRLHPEANWTQADNDAIGQHFTYLQAAVARRQAVVVGRTLESRAHTFGVVIFEAADLDTAQAFAANDPAVLAGVMTFEVRPFSLIMERKE